MIRCMVEENVDKILAKGSVTLRCLFVVCALAMAPMVITATS